MMIFSYSGVFEAWNVAQRFSRRGDRIWADYIQNAVKKQAGEGGRAMLSGLIQAVKKVVELM